MSRVEVTQESAPLSDGMLQTVLPLSATSQFVKDNAGNTSVLSLSTSLVGVGTTTGTAKLTIKGSGTTSATTSFAIQNSSGQELATFRDDVFASIFGTFRVLDSAGNNAMIMYGDGLGGTKTLWVNGNIGAGVLGGTARLQVKGSGSTSATTSLLVQNSAGTQTLKVNDDGSINIGQQSNNNFPYINLSGIYGGLFLNTGDSIVFRSAGTEAMRVNAALSVGIGASTINASAKLQVDTTTQGFLPPRMSTADKNLIATPAAGLIVYDTTLNKLCVRTVATWETITSI